MNALIASVYTQRPQHDPIPARVVKIGFPAAAPHMARITLKIEDRPIMQIIKPHLKRLRNVKVTSMAISDGVTPILTGTIEFGSTKQCA